MTELTPFGGAAALRHLRRDAVLKRVIGGVGACDCVVTPCEPYQALIRAIAHQQVHGRAAEAVLGRFRALFPAPHFPAPAEILALPPEALRGCGFSANKVAAVRDIAEKAAAGLVPSLAASRALDDAALIEQLVALRGVGRWTVEMLLIFTLGREDVLPVDDFGVREGWRLASGAAEQLKPKALAALGEAWAPHRTTAAWYLWRAADAAKKVKP